MVKTVDYREIMAEFHVMALENWPYSWSGHSHMNVSCAGAFYYAYQLHGLKCANGSNAFARESVTELVPITKAVVRPGVIAFKAKVPGEKGYSLPAKYTKGKNPDLHDYYHMGMVDEDGRYVLNAKGEAYGYVRSPITEGWDYVAYAKDLIYDGEAETMSEQLGKVVANEGSTVNLRKSTSISSDLVDRVPVGKTVTILEDAGTWCRIKYGDKIGWMMSNYLDYVGMPKDDNDPLTESERGLVQQAIDLLNKAMEGGGGVG